MAKFGKAQKRCARCMEVKSVTSFGLQKDSPDGYGHYCVTCKREYERLRYEFKQGRLENTEEMNRAKRIITEAVREFGIKALVERSQLHYRTVDLAYKNPIMVHPRALEKIEQVADEMLHPAKKEEEEGKSSKICAICKEEKAYEEFDKAPTRDGYAVLCRVCADTELDRLARMQNKAAEAGVTEEDVYQALESAEDIILSDEEDEAISKKADEPEVPTDLVIPMPAEGSIVDKLLGFVSHIETLEREHREQADRIKALEEELALYRQMDEELRAAKWETERVKTILEQAMRALGGK